MCGHAVPKHARGHTRTFGNVYQKMATLVRDDNSNNPHQGLKGSLLLVNWKLKRIFNFSVLWVHFLATLPMDWTSEWLAQISQVNQYSTMEADQCIHVYLIMKFEDHNCETSVRVYSHATCAFAFFLIFAVLFLTTQNVKYDHHH